MGKVHSIRLREPWQRAMDASTGTTQWSRRFHTPTNIDPHETIWLCLREFSRRVTVRLNEEILGEVIDSAEFEVTQRIQRNNWLELVFPEGELSALPGEVGIEIRSNE